MKIFIVLLMFFGGCLGGCSIPLEGGGKFSIGYESKSAIVFQHTVDGDKEGKTSKSSIEPSPWLERVLASLLGVKEEQTAASENDAE